MIRPARRRSMPRRAARVRRNGAVRSTSSTAAQSSSCIRSASRSRVKPALLTRMASGPAAASAAVDQGFGGGGVAQVGGADMGAVAEFGGQRLQRVLPRAGQHHRRALRVQRARDRGADAARGAGHQRRLAVQPEHFFARLPVTPRCRPVPANQSTRRAAVSRRPASPSTESRKAPCGPRRRTRAAMAGNTPGDSLLIHTALRSADGGGESVARGRVGDVGQHRGMEHHQRRIARCLAREGFAGRSADRRAGCGGGVGLGDADGGAQLLQPGGVLGPDQGFQPGALRGVVQVDGRQVEAGAPGHARQSVGQRRGGAGTCLEDRRLGRWRRDAVAAIGVAVAVGQQA